MTYRFACDHCHTVEEREQRMGDDHTPPSCLNCLTPMRRLWESRFNCDEIRGVKYFDPKVKAERVAHGKVYDIGLGGTYSSYSERRKLMKKRNLQEHGETHP